MSKKAELDQIIDNLKAAIDETKSKNDKKRKLIEDIDLVLEALKKN
jgi:molecular chaperone GrpE (heat shock protein)